MFAKAHGGNARRAGQEKYSAQEIIERRQCKVVACTHRRVRVQAPGSPGAPMKLGLVYPQTEFGSDLGLIREFAITAEELGYQQLILYEHVLGADPQVHELSGPYTWQTEFHEPFVLFGYLSAVTTSMQLVTGILVLPQRPTALVAKQAATLDFVSSGRLVLGVGVGWNQVEYVGLGQDFHRRGARIEEQIPLLRRLWCEPLLDFEGTFDRITAAGIAPRPTRHIPIWMGGWADAVLERTGRLADGWLTAAGSPKRWRDPNRIRTPGDLKRRLGIVQDAARGAGRDPAAIEVSMLVSVIGFEEPERFDAGAWAARGRAWGEAGATSVALATLDLGFSPAEHLDAMVRFAQAWKRG